MAHQQVVDYCTSCNVKLDANGKIVSVGLSQGTVGQDPPIYCRNIHDKDHIFKPIASNNDVVLEIMEDIKDNVTHIVEDRQDAKERRQKAATYDKVAHGVTAFGTVAGIVSLWVYPAATKVTAITAVAGLGVREAFSIWNRWKEQEKDELEQQELLNEMNRGFNQSRRRFQSR